MFRLVRCYLQSLAQPGVIVDAEQAALIGQLAEKCCELCRRLRHRAEERLDALIDSRRDEIIGRLNARRGKYATPEEQAWHFMKSIRLP